MSNAVWRTGAFAGEFGDAFIRNTDLEGGHCGDAIGILIDVLQKDIISNPNTLEELSLFSQFQIDSLSRIIRDLKWAVEVDTLISRAAKADAKTFAELLDLIVSRISSMNVGDRIMVPGGWATPSGGHAIIYIIECVSDRAFAWCVCNTGNGLNYHPSKGENYPKIKFLTAMRFSDISFEKISSKEFWYMLLNLKVTVSKTNGPKLVYEVFLPFLAGGVLHEAVERCLESGGHWETPQRSGTCFYRCILTAFRYLMKLDGYEKAQQKQLFVRIRRGFLNAVERDLQNPDFRGTFNSSDAFMVELACNQTGYAAGKFYKSNCRDQDREEKSRRTLVEMDRQFRRIKDTVAQLLLESPAKQRTGPCTTTVFDSEHSKVVMRPFSGFDLLLDENDRDLKRGITAVGSTSLFVNLLIPFASPTSVRETLPILVWAADRCDDIRTKSNLTAVTVGLNQVCSFIEYLFLNFLPMPPALHDTELYEPWLDNVIDSDEQYQILLRLSKLSNHYVAAAFSLGTSDRSHNAGRAVTTSLIYCFFDRIIRTHASPQPLPVSVLLEEYDCVISSKICGNVPILNFFDKTLLLRPELCRARAKVVQYLQDRTRPKALFEYIIADAGNFNLSFDEDNQTIAFVDELRSMTNTMDAEPPKTADRKGKTIGSRISVFNSLESCYAWFSSSWSGVASEFALLRDMNLVARLMMQPGAIFTTTVPTDIWLTHHAQPEFDFISVTQDRKAVMFTIILGGQQISPSCAYEHKSPMSLYSLSEAASEEDILFNTSLPDFGHTLSPQEAEQLFSFLLFPHLAVPLVLSFFTGDRIALLVNKQIQVLIESAMFEPGTFVASSDQAAALEITQVPAKHRHHLGTTYGILYDEVRLSPSTVYPHLIVLIENALTISISGHNSSVVDLVLFLVRISVRVQSFCMEIASLGQEIPADAVRLQRLCETKVVKRINIWVESALKVREIDHAVKFQAHLSLIYAISLDLILRRNPSEWMGTHEFEEYLQRFMCAATYVVSWHSKEKSTVVVEPMFRSFFTPKKKKLVEPPTPVDEVPVSQVFTALQRFRGIIDSWVRQASSNTIDTILDAVASSSLQHPFKECAGWEKVSSSPMVCSVTVGHDKHPYPPGSDWSQTISFPGASSINIYFNPLSATEAVHDYVSISYPGCYLKFDGPAGSTWPGANGSPALNIPFDTFVVSFHSDRSGGDWGFELTAVAPICLSSVTDLMASTDASSLVCQFALKKSCNFVQLARELIASDRAALEELEARELTRRQRESAVDVAPGLFQDSIGYVQVNFQTCEVFVNNRMSMPVPTNISSHTDYKQMFSNHKNLFCTLSSFDTHRKCFQLIDPEGRFGSYEIQAWTPLKPYGSRGSGRGAILQDESEGISDDGRCTAFNMPLGGEKFLFCGRKFVRYGSGTCGWMSHIFDRLDFENDDDVVGIWRSENCDTFQPPESDCLDDREEGYLLVKLQCSPGGRDLSDIEGHPGAWYEVQAVPKERVLLVFALIEVGRKMQRQLVYSSDIRLAFKTLNQSTKFLEIPRHPLLQYEGGFILDGFKDDQGRVVSRPGVGSKQLETVDSLIIRRSRIEIAKSDESESQYKLSERVFCISKGLILVESEEHTLEEYISPACLEGIIPQYFLETFQFWRTGERIIRGYQYSTSASSTFQSTSLLLVLNKDDSSATIHRLVNGRRVDTLLNPLHPSFRGMPVCPTMRTLVSTFSSVECLSHVLFWTKSPIAPDSVSDSRFEISRVELPRLKTAFEIRYNDEQFEYVLADHDDLSLCTEVPPEVHSLFRDFSICLPLRNSTNHYFILVPSFGLIQPSVKSCPFMTQIAFDRSNTWFDKVQSRYYVYPVHASCTFLEMPSISAALYWTLLCFVYRKYVTVANLVNTVCHSDLTLNEEQRYILSQIPKTFADSPTSSDSHPDAHACRLMLALMCIECGENPTSQTWAKTFWNVKEDFQDYLSKYAHVSHACRLQIAEEQIILQHFADASRSAYLTTVERVLETQQPSTYFSKGNPASTSCDAVTLDGGTKFSPLMKSWMREIDGSGKATRSKYGRSVGDFFYRRPSSDLGPVDGITSLASFWNCYEHQRSLSGSLSYLGFAYLYDFLTGQLVLNFDTNVALESEWVVDDVAVEAQDMTQSPGLEQQYSEQVLQLQSMGLCEDWTPAEVAMLLHTSAGDMEAAVNAVLSDPDVRLRCASVLSSSSVREDPATAATINMLLETKLLGDMSAVEVTAFIKMNNGDADKCVGIYLSDPDAARAAVNKYLQDEELKLKKDEDDRRTPRRFPRSWLLVKFIAQVLFCIDSGGNNKQIVLLLSLVKSIEDSCNTGTVPRLPLFPYDTNREELDSQQGLSAKSIAPFMTKILEAGISSLANRKLPIEPLSPSAVFNSTICVTPESHRVRHELSDNSCSRRFLQLVQSGGLVPTELLVDADTLHAFGSMPLRSLESFSELKMVPVACSGSAELPFDISQHPAALNNPPADSMIQRIKDDLIQSSGATASVPSLRFMGPLSSLTSTSSKLQQLVVELSELLAADNAIVISGIKFIESKLNITASENDSLDHILLRFQFNSGVRSRISFEMFAASLSSSCQLEDLQRLNPFLTEDLCNVLNSITISILMRFVRSRQTASCLDKSRTLLRLIRLPASSGHSLSEHILQHQASQLAEELAKARYYVTRDSDGRFHMDPRFLLFEFITGFLLRKRQVELVQDFMAARLADRSSVHQMIMGAGKTQVIAPILSLMLADGASLVTIVCPGSLLPQSRSYLRCRFSNILPKRILTLTFERSSSESNTLEGIQSLFKKLDTARKQRSVVLSTPQSVKSLFLKYVDLIQQVKNAPAILQASASTVGSVVAAKLLPRAQTFRENLRIIDELRKVLQLWSSGVALLDEVDLLLHPLKSELNFPIGVTEPLPLLPYRFELPQHLIDAFFLKNSRALRKDEANVWSEVQSRIELGKQLFKFQSIPHLVLLDETFYISQLRFPVAKWCVLWLSKQQCVVQDINSAEGSSPTSNALANKLLVDYIYCSEGQPRQLRAARFVKDVCSEVSTQLLNLARGWVWVYLPHALSKIHRVSYGLIGDEDIQRWVEQEIEAAGGDLSAASRVVISRSRRLLAVPFVGKDVPSRSSEFANPEVQIGLTILSYKLDGLRHQNFKDLLTELKRNFLMEPGPFSDRKSRLMFEEWKANALLDSSSGHSSEDMLPLEVLQTVDEVQMRIVQRVLKTEAGVVRHYLSKFVFPNVLKYKAKKIQANGVDLGGDSLFGHRYGFSGTPSDLLPLDIRPCHYEAGSEAEIIRTLSSDEVLSAPEHLSIGQNWTVDMLLERVASGDYSALIDSGALITGYTTEQVARKLLLFQPPHKQNKKEVCVFLDERDLKMVVDLSGGPAYEIDRCGVKLEKRFVFYDHVHTTGIDIKHTLDATAVCTLGKDLTLRDYAQGCWRMRGLGVGQRIHVLIIEEINRLIQASSEHCPNKLSAILAWLTVNSITSEKLQFLQLESQIAANVPRKQAFRELMSSELSIRDPLCSNMILPSPFFPPLSTLETDAALTDASVPSEWLEDSKPTTSHLGEWRSYSLIQKQRKYCDVDSFIDESCCCKHYFNAYRVIQGCHWSCCGNRLEQSTACGDSCVPGVISEFGELDDETVDEFIRSFFNLKFEATNQRLCKELLTTLEILIPLEESNPVVWGQLNGYFIPPAVGKRMGTIMNELSMLDYAIGAGKDKVVPIILKFLSMEQEGERVVETISAAVDAVDEATVQMFCSRAAILRDAIDIFVEAINVGISSSVGDMSGTEDGAGTAESFGAGHEEEDEEGVYRAEGNNDREIVQEQEKEKDEEREMEVFKVVHPEADKDPETDSSWLLADLLGDGAVFRAEGRNHFYPLKDFSLTPHALSKVPYPADLFASESYAPFFHLSTSSRRLKNVNVLMRYKDSATVIISLAESETLRFVINRIPELRQIIELHSIEPALKGFALTTTALTTAASSCSLEDATSAVGNNSTDKDLAVQFARYFNNCMYFGNDVVCRLLLAFESIDKERRRDLFELSGRCRLRDQSQWTDSPVAHIFLHDTSQNLSRILDIISSIAYSLSKEFVSVEQAFTHFAGPNSREISPSELKLGLERMSLSVPLSEDDAISLTAFLVSTSSTLKDQSGLPCINKNTFTALCPNAFSVDSSRQSLLSPLSMPLNEETEHDAGYNNIFRGHNSTILQNSNANLVNEFYSHLHTPNIQSIGQLIAISQPLTGPSGRVDISNDNTITTDSDKWLSVAPRGVRLLPSSGVWCFELIVIRPALFFVGFAESMDGSVVSSTPKPDHHSMRSVTFNDAEEGDVIRFIIDVRDAINISFKHYRHGGAEQWGAAATSAFSQLDFPRDSPIFPFITFNASLKWRLNLGNMPFSPLVGKMPEGSHSLFHWIRCQQEREYVRYRHSLGGYGTLANVSGKFNLDIIKRPNKEYMWEMKMACKGSEQRASQWNSAFPTVFIDGVVLTQGQWYYEVTINSNNVASQFGWADLDFIASNENGQGVGDDKHSWAFDGDRKCLWHNTSISYGEFWKVGDVLGIACDLDIGVKTISFSLNGVWMQPVAFSGVQYSVGLTPSLTTQARISSVSYYVNCSRDWRFAPPSPKYRPICQWVEYGRQYLSRGVTDNGSGDGDEDEDEDDSVASKPVKMIRQESAQPKMYHSAELWYIPLAVKSGHEQVSISHPQLGAEDSCSTRVKACGEDDCVYPSVVADRISLSSGKWFYEVTLLTAPTAAKCSFGFAEVNWDGGNWSELVGVGDDRKSWGVFCKLGNEVSSRWNKMNTTTDASCPHFVLSDATIYPISIAIAVDCNSKKMLMSINAGSAVEVFSDVDFSVGITPAFSLQSSSASRSSRSAGLAPQLEFEVNFGNKAFFNSVFSQSGYHPIHNKLFARF